MGNLLPTMQPFWFHLSFYSSLYKLINRKVEMKKVSFLHVLHSWSPLCIPHRWIKHPGVPGSPFSLRDQSRTPLPTPNTSALLPGASHHCLKVLVSFASGLILHLQLHLVSGTQRPRSPSFSTFSSLPHSHCLAGGWLLPLSAPVACRHVFYWL